MPTTGTGLVYPASTDSTQIWTHIQNLANSADTLLSALFAYLQASGTTLGGFSPYSVYGGFVSITPSAANTPTSATVTLPTGRFTQTPVGVASASTSVPGTTVTGQAAVPSSTTSVTVWVTRTNTTATFVHYLLYQATAASASG